jgi:hypothetical protein
MPIRAAATLAGGEDAGVAGDVDADGVPDDADQCDDTAAGEVVGADGCSACACGHDVDGSPWTSHRRYVACVGVEARTQTRAGLLTRKERRAAMRHAASSTCGRPEVVRCCVYADLGDDVGGCRFTTPDQCDAIADRTLDGDAEDEGPGSCVPNPCVF